MSSIFANEAKPNVAGANGQQFPGKVPILVDQSQDFALGYIEKSVESSVMFLHAGISKVVTVSARKRLQPWGPVKFEGSTATPWTEQAQALATSAGRHHSEFKAMPEAAQRIRRLHTFAVLNDYSSMNTLWPAHLSSLLVIGPGSSD